jgi:diaminopimelate decarboxylase
MQTERGATLLGGVDANVLAQTYGTPLLALDTDVLDARVAEFAAAGERLGIEVCYAAKALLFVALARRLARSPLGIDVCSLGELLTVERAGFEPERIVMHGCGKSAAELQAAVDGRVGRVVVDNAAELERLAALADAARPVSILLRLNTGIEARTHAYVRTGGEDSKFGFGFGSLDAAIAVAVKRPGLRAIGIHSHIGSQIYEAEPFTASARFVVDAYARLRAAGAPASEIVVGGGFGVGVQADGERFDLTGTLESVLETVRSEAFARRVPVPRIGIEPGRSIVAEAGTSLYRVASVKRQGARRFAIVDGGIADNPRPALYGAYHHPFLAGRTSSATPVDVTICGRSCENDRLVMAPLPEDLAAGDLIGLETTGAYTYSMASNYNRFPKPAVAFAGAGRHRLVVRRESDADLLRNDLDEEA